MEINLKRLAKLMNEYSAVTYSLPQELKLSINPDLKQVVARYILDTNQIELAAFLKDFQYLNLDELLNILKHEVTHVYARQRNLGYGDGSQDFENLLQAHHLPTTNPISTKLVETTLGLVNYDSQVKRVLIKKYQ